MATLLGFDFGTQKIGVAIGQSVTGTANALAHLRSRQQKPDWQSIERLIVEWQPDALVVGLPLLEDGSDSPMTARAQRFARQLEGRFRLPVHMADERYTSVVVRQSRNPKSAVSVDAESAKLILETWLSEH